MDALHGRIHGPFRLALSSLTDRGSYWVTNEFSPFFFLFFFFSTQGFDTENFRRAFRTICEGPNSSVFDSLVWLASSSTTLGTSVPMKHWLVTELGLWLGVWAGWDLSLCSGPFFFVFVALSFALGGLYAVQILHVLRITASA